MEKVNLDEINSMDGFSFEDLISNLITKMGFIVEQTKKTADGGIDINAYSDEPIISGNYVIQCKRSASPISESVIRDLYGVMTAEKANKGILITNSRFTSPSISFAADKPIELIDGDKLIDLLSKHYDFESDDNEVKIPLYQKLLFKEIIKKCNEIEKNYEDTKKGLVLKSKKTIKSSSSCITFLGEKAGMITQFVEGLNSWFEVLNEEPSQDNINISQFIKPKVEKFNFFLESFFNKWEELFFTKCPEELLLIHNSILKMYDSIFSDMFSWIGNLDDSLKNPRKYLTSDNSATVSLTLGESESYNEAISAANYEIQKYVSETEDSETNNYTSQSE